MRRTIGMLVLLGVLSLAVTVPSAAAQSYGPGLGPGTWYGPFLGPGTLNGPYGGIGASGFGATGYGCGQGAYGFSNYSYGVGLGLGFLMPTCGGFGNYPYLYPYYTGYPFATGTSAMGALSLSQLAGPNPFFGQGCDALSLGSSFAGQPNTIAFAGPAGQYSLGANLNVLNLSNPALSTLSNFGTFGAQNVGGCIAFR